MKFNRLEHSKKFVSNPGSRFREKFHGVVKEDGHIELVSDGFEDVKEKMRADAVGSSLPEIIARATAGDPTAFRKDVGWFGDVVGMPKTYAEVLNLVNDGREKFESLPVDVREKFDFDFNKWFATMGTNDWFEKHGLNSKSDKVSETVEEIKE